jgi:hypothetical protein
MTGLLATRGIWSASPAMEWKVGATQQAVNGSSKRLEDESEKRWALMSSVVLSFIYIVDDSMMIRFPRKRYIFISTTHAIRMWNREAKKFGSLKYFEVCGVPKKEPRISGWYLLSRSRRSFTQSRKEKLRHCPIGLLKLASYRHQRSPDI